MQDKARWYWYLLWIAFVLGGAAWLLYPPQQQLKLGLDLQGGTTFVYEVEVRSGESSAEAIETTIATLKKRIDPNGIMNLVWRRLAGNRFEVQMPAAVEGTEKRRNAYLQAQSVLLDSNITRGAAQRILALTPGERPQAIDALLGKGAGGNKSVRQLLTALAQAHDEWQQVRQVYDEAEKQKQEAQQALDAMAATSNEATQKPLQKALDGALKRVIAKAGDLVAARKKLGQGWEELLGTNIDPLVVDVALSKPVRGRADAPSERQMAIAALIEKHPGQADAIGTLARTYAAYEEVKGPLDDPNDLIALLRGSGVLEFRIAPRVGLANEAKYREQLTKRGPRGEGGDLYRWFEIEDITGFADKIAEQQQLLADPAEYFRSYYAAGAGLIADRFSNKIYLLLSNASGSSITRNQTGWKLASARAGSDQLGLPAVFFLLNTVGGQYMAQLTEAHKREHMAIVLDDKVISAPTINDTIGSDGILTRGGGYGQKEMRYLIRTLNAGSLQERVSDEPIYVRTFNAAFGQDNLMAGLKASYWALIVVAGFMAVYYLFMGLIANFALFGNMVLILGIMSVFQATFTLPGIAGIVLTIGMAVDANVLIFERIREEFEHGAAIRPAVRTGYGKALATIIDANLTTLITCLVLGYTATAEIKGFAVTLGIGILATMFTALLCTRTWLEIFLNVTGAKSLVSIPMLIPAVGKLLHPNINWVGKHFAMFTLSGILMVAGAIMVYERGEDMFDIEFRSGTQVGFTLAGHQTMELGQVRQRLTQISQEAGIAELAGDRAKVVITGESEGDVGRSFNISTLAKNHDNRISKAITAAFDDVLDVTRALSFTADTAQTLDQAPVRMLTTAQLGDNIDRPEFTEDVGDFRGGVAIVIDNMSPSVSIADIRKRIDRARMQPPHDQYGYRKTAVFGLDLAPRVVPVAGDDTGIKIDEARYRSVVIVTRDNSTNYVENPQSFDDGGGLAATQWHLVRDALTRDASLGFVTEISPQISTTMRWNAIGAIGLSLVAVVCYIWLRFGSLRYGLAAIIALVHDVTIALGIVAVVGLVSDSELGRSLLLSDFKIDLAMVAALLTIVGYSLNDTIVVFDRIRENRGRLTFATSAVINDSINQTMSRTILTSLTTSLALITLYIFGGDGVHGFAFTMLIGVVVGTYSSIAIAAPIVLIGKNKDH